MSEHKSYLGAVEAYIANDHAAMAVFLAGAAGSLSEKKLIRARQAARSGDYTAALEILTSMTPETAFLKAEHHFVYANVLSHKSLWQEALVHAQQALVQYTLCSNVRGQFLANYNLSVYYNRLGLDTASLHHIHASEQLAQGPGQVSLVARALACHYARSLDFANALSALDEALDRRDHLDEVDQAALNSVAADLYFRAGHLDTALRFIETLSRSRVVRDKARVRFDLTVLRAMVEGSRKLVSGPMPEVVAENEEYRLRWEIIENLQSGDWSTAETRWERLCALFPLRFAAGFKCLNESDEKLIFIVAIRSLMSAPQEFASVELTGKPRKLFETLKSAPVPLRKEELIERVWGLPYHPSLDARFYKLVERLRKDGRLAIESVNHTYRLIS